MAPIYRIQIIGFIELITQTWEEELAIGCFAVLQGSEFISIYISCSFRNFSNLNWSLILNAKQVQMMSLYFSVVVLLE